MNDLNALTANVNRVLAGQQEVKVQASVDTTSVLLIGLFLFIACSLGTAVGNLITK